MKKKVSELLLALWMSTAALAQQGTFEGVVSTVDPATGVLVVRSSQGSVRVELHKESALLINGKSNNLGQLQAGDHVRIEGIALKDGTTVASRLISFGKDATFALEPSVDPAPDSQTTENRPSVRVTFDGPVQKAQFWLDGQDFTGESYISGTTLKWTPGFNLSQGEHLLRIVASVGEGTSVTQSRQWRFRVLSEVKAWPASPQVFSPLPGSRVSTVQPQVVASFPEDIHRAALLLDGKDLSSQVAIFGNRISYSPDSDLKGGKHEAVVFAEGSEGQQYSYTWNFLVPRKSSEQAFTPTEILEYRPGRGAVLESRRPTISCQFSRSVDRNSIQAVVDGHVLTEAFDRSGNKVSWTPGYDLEPGQHIVRVSALDSNGAEVSTNWTFIIAPPNDGNR